MEEVTKLGSAALGLLEVADVLVVNEGAPVADGVLRPNEAAAELLAALGLPALARD